MNTGHLSVYLVVFRLVFEDVDEGEDEDGRHVNRERDEEHEKITVVATTYAVVHPGAVMVKDLENKRNETLGSLKSQLSNKIISNKRRYFSRYGKINLFCQKICQMA